MTKKYLTDPFNALYQEDSFISDRPEIQELNEYALGLEDRIEGDFNLEYIAFEFAYNRLAYIRNGLLLAKLKFLKLHKRFGDGTFARARGCGFPAAFMSPASFCRERLKIKAARVCMELIYAGFEVLPTNISQAMAIASLTGEELVHAWRSVTESIEPDKITHRSIKSFLFPPTISDLPDTKIRVDPTLHEDLHREAAMRCAHPTAKLATNSSSCGISIVDLIRVMFDFFITGGATKNFSDNSHLFERMKTRGRLALFIVRCLHHDANGLDYAERERIWREDLANLVNESGSEK